MLRKACSALEDFALECFRSFRREKWQVGARHRERCLDPCSAEGSCCFEIGCCEGWGVRQHGSDERCECEPQIGRFERDCAGSLRSDSGRWRSSINAKRSQQSIERFSVTLGLSECARGDAFEILGERVCHFVGKVLLGGTADQISESSCLSDGQACGNPTPATIAWTAHPFHQLADGPVGDRPLSLQHHPTPSSRFLLDRKREHRVIADARASMLRIRV